MIRFQCPCGLILPSDIALDRCRLGVDFSRITTSRNQHMERMGEKRK